MASHALRVARMQRCAEGCLRTGEEYLNALCFNWRSSWKCELGNEEQPPIYRQRLLCPLSARSPEIPSLARCAGIAHKPQPQVRPRFCMPYWGNNNISWLKKREKRTGVEGKGTEDRVWSNARQIWCVIMIFSGTNRAVVQGKPSKPLS